MIYIVEFPHQGRAHCWFAFDREDFILKVRASRARDAGLIADGIAGVIPSVIFDALSARERLAAHGLSPESPEASHNYAELCELARVHGWDAPLYRADDLLGPGVLQAEPVDEFAASVAALVRGLKTCRVHLSDEQAIEALQREPLYDLDDGFHAHMALREQLIAMEAMEEDL